MSEVGVAATLRAAADHVEAVGLYQGGNFFAPPISDDERKPFAERACCAIGAIRAVDGFYIPIKGSTYPTAVGDDVENPEAQPRKVLDIWELDNECLLALSHELEARGIRRGIPSWSDHVAKDEHEVAAVLRAAAERYERSTDDLIRLADFLSEHPEPAS